MQVHCIGLGLLLLINRRLGCWTCTPVAMSTRESTSDFVPERCKAGQELQGTWALSLLFDGTVEHVINETRCTATLLWAKRPLHHHARWSSASQAWLLPWRPDVARAHIHGHTHTHNHHQSNVCCLAAIGGLYSNHAPRPGALGVYGQGHACKAAAWLFASTS